jgi:hypothetical protein
MKRPVVVTIIGWFFIIAGTVGFIYHVTELNIQDPFVNDAIWILLVRLLAIAGGMLTLRGANTGRWLLVIWLSYHVVLSYFHTLSELIMHAILLAAVIYVLFHPKATAFFKNVKLNRQKE